jgi:hypothetical protein
MGALVADPDILPNAESQKRRSTRIAQAVPLTVTGVDALGRPFQERTSTLTINCHGCRYQSKHYVLKNMWVTFEVPHNEPGREPRSVRARVIWIQRPRTVRELFQIGAELEVPGNVWGIAFPPGDWFPFPETASKRAVPAATEPAEMTRPSREWIGDAPSGPPSPEPPEDNVRVLSLPSNADASAQLTRHVARLVTEAKQQMQLAMEKGLEQAAASLHEKAGDVSGLFARELDQYSRNYVEHAQTQMEENAREVAEKASLQMAQAGEAAATNFTDRADQLTREQYDLFQAKSNSTFEQNAASIEAHAVQVRSKLESDARTLVGEFQRVIAQQAQESLAQGKQELAAQIEQANDTLRIEAQQAQEGLSRGKRDLAAQIEHAKDSLRIEAESLDNQLRTSMESLGTHAMNEYKERLENASNSWLLTTVTRLNQQSEELIDQLLASTEKRLRSTCNDVFDEIGETFRQRLAGLLVPSTAQTVPAASSTPVKTSEINPEEQK